MRKGRSSFGSRSQLNCSQASQTHLMADKSRKWLASRPSQLNRLTNHNTQPVLDVWTQQRYDGSPSCHCAWYRHSVDLSRIARRHWCVERFEHVNSVHRWCLCRASNRKSARQPVTLADAKSAYHDRHTCHSKCQRQYARQSCQSRRRSDTA